VGALGHVFERQLQCDDLAQRIGDLLGAHILLLDVDRAPGPVAKAEDRIAGWENRYPETRHDTAVVRYAWLGRPDAPRDVRLLRGLEEVLPHTSRLVEVTAALRRFPALPNLTALVYDEYVADPMKDLALGRGNP
jgi:hypothetical protein